MTTDEPKFKVQDGPRVLAFDGQLLAESTSQRYDSERWVEFKLYKTNGGSYVLSRIGRSIIFHAPTCTLVKQYNLKKGLPETEGVPCQTCNPDDYADRDLYPEKQRYWAQVMERPQAILEALTKYDSDGARYLTNVAQRLLERAGEKDPKVETIYRTEIIA